MLNKTAKNSNKLKEAILETIAFFDIFNFPLNTNEIYLYCKCECEVSDIVEVLPKLKKQVEEKNGFYFLYGRHKIVETRMRRYNYANRKIKRAIKVARFFKIIPWIKMIAVGNLIGFNNLKDSGDIDFFIITDKKRIWMTRFFCAGFLKVLNLRPKENNKRDKICLSFYISEENLNIKDLMLDSEDKYFIYWLAGLLPIYNNRETYQKFVKANSWIYEFLPNWNLIIVSRRIDAGAGFSFFYKDLCDMFFGGFEKNVKKLQMKIMPSVLRNKINKGKSVVVNDKVLKLYAKDKRGDITKKLKNKRDLIYG